MLAPIMLFLASAAFATPSSPVEKILAGLSVEQKVGQLFMIAIDTEIAANYEPQIRAGRLGGVLLRWDRFTGGQVRDFVAKMRDWTDATPGKLPLLFSSDHEGGPLFTQRMYGGTIFPGNMALGAAGSAALAEEAAYDTARELKDLGIQIDFAPVLDVNNNPDNPIIGIRSFGENPAKVAIFGVAAIRGYQRGGVIPAAKHFPGHGNTAVNSHLDLPVIAHSMKEWEKTELVPFRAAIKAGVPMIMTAHIVVPAIDPTLPVTLSSAAIDGFLRKKLGFGGVVVSDSLDMAAIAKTYGMPEAAVRAFEAGCDILLLGKGDFPGSYDRVLASVRQGRVSEKRLDQSVRRILKIKDSSGLLRFGIAAHQDLARRIAEASITLVRNQQSLVPFRLPEDKTLVVLMARHSRYAAEAALFKEELLKRHARTEFIELTPRPDVKAIDEAVEKARGGHVFLLASYQIDTLDSRDQVELYRRLAMLGKPIIIASLMNPYDLKNFPEARTQLCTYGITPASLRALVRVLFGEIKPKGRRP